MFKRFIRFVKNLFRKSKNVIVKKPKIIVSKPSKKNEFYEFKYQKMFKDFEMKDSILPMLEMFHAQIVTNKKRYLIVEKVTNVPWEVIACIHLLEGSLRFTTVLHNGESLYHVNKYGTRLVPKHRGKGLIWSWEDAAIDALFLEKHKFPTIWSAGSSLVFLESFNGFGYRKKGIESPYLWSYTNYYTKGKYVSDGKYDRNAVSKQIGASVVLKKLNYLTIEI